MLVAFFLTVAAALTTTMMGDLEISGKLNCGNIVSETLYSSGTVHTTSSLTVADITSTSTTVSELTLSSIYPIDSEITIEADVLIKAPLETTSFLQMYWNLFSHEDFEKDAEGWNAVRSTCNKRDYFIQGFSDEEIKKTYKLPLHSSVKITASVHFLDTWQGESLILKANGQIIWMQSARSGNTNICANSEPDAGYGVPIDIDYKSTSRTLDLLFTSNVKGQSSFGVDDIILYVK